MSAASTVLSPSPAFGGVGGAATYGQAVRLVGLDFEATDVDPRKARPVAAALVELRDGQTGDSSEWLIDPDVEIPADATAVHGITTERVRQGGMATLAAAPIIADAIVAIWRAGVPLVVFNAAYDLTLLETELARHRLPGLAARLGAPLDGANAPVIDPLVLVRRLRMAQPYVPGMNCLGAACAYYQVPLRRAHHALADAEAAARLAARLPHLYPGLGDLSLAELHERQTRWAAASRRGGRPGNWPIQTARPTRM